MLSEPLRKPGLPSRSFWVKLSTVQQKISEFCLDMKLRLTGLSIKALHELQRLQAARHGSEVPVPTVLDVNVHGI